MGKRIAALLIAFSAAWGLPIALLRAQAPQSPVPAQEDDSTTITLELLQGRAAWYVDDFINSFSNVVTQETYVQDVSVPLSTVAALRGRGSLSVASALLNSGSRHRVLRSDFLLVALRGTFEWVPFRDVFEVDSVPVRDRQDRLTKLFLQPAPTNVEQARRISDESTRYNLGNMERTINNPILAMAILQGELQQRFRFTLAKRDPVVGAWIIDYQEQQRPTLIRGPSDIDLYAHGRLWLDDTGRLLKSEVLIEQPRLVARVVTDFRYDERFKIAVPIQMHEEYQLDGGTRVTAAAVYDRFRHFGVSTDESVQDESPNPAR